MNTETWYVLESDEAVDPREVTADKNGVLRHKDGPVAMRGDVPRSRSVDPDAERSKAKSKADQAKAKADREKAEADAAKAKAEAEAKAKVDAERAAAQSKDMKPAPAASTRGGYMTRDAKLGETALPPLTERKPDDEK